MKSFIYLAIAALASGSILGCWSKVNSHSQGDKELNVNEDQTSDSLMTKIYEVKSLVNRIENHVKWTDTKEKELYETSEGGMAEFYYEHDMLIKIVTHQFGETFQRNTVFYLNEGRLFYVEDETLLYNRPINYTVADAEEYGDSTFFDVDKAEVIQCAYYYEGERLFYKEFLSPETSSQEEIDWVKRMRRLIQIGNQE